MWCPEIKPPWLGEIKEDIIVFSLRERILENILYEALHREIGLNILIEEGLGSFGTRDRKVELVAPPIFPLDIQEITCSSSFFIIDQHIL